MWRGDSVQLGVHLGSGLSSSLTEVTAANAKSGPALYRHSAESGDKTKEGPLNVSSLRTARAGDTLLYIIKLDAKELGVDTLAGGSILGFSILVNNSDGTAGRTGYLHWGNGIDNTKNANEFNELLLSPAPAGP